MSASEDAAQIGHATRIGHDPSQLIDLGVGQRRHRRRFTSGRALRQTQSRHIKTAVQRVVALLQVLADDGIEGHFGTSTAPVGDKTPNECPRNADERPLLVHPDIRNAVALGKNSAAVLLVEDEPLIRQATTEFLSDCGHSVLAAASAEEALQRIKEYKDRVDLVITDLMLPRVISGHSRGTALGESAGQQGRLLAKPFSFPILHMKIREMLAQKARAPAAGSSE